MAAGTQIGNVLFTDVGGIATKMVAEENLNAGELVSAGTVNGKVVKTATSGKTTLGIVFESVLANADVWVVTSGIANILPEAGVTATRGQVAFSSASTAGRAAQSATDASRKVGVFIASGTGAGVLTQAVLQLVGVDATFIGAGITAFQWSASEQTWPFEKSSGGDTLYAVQVDCSGLPNATTKTVAHGIGSLTMSKVHLFYVMGVDGSGYCFNTFHADDGTYRITAYLDATNIFIMAGSNRSGGTAYARIIYAK